MANVLVANVRLHSRPGDVTVAEAPACAIANVPAAAIPCHRVLRNDRSISRPRRGVRRERSLLRSGHAR